MFLSLIGLVIIFYPILGRHFFNKEQNRKIEEFKKEIILNEEVRKEQILDGEIIGFIKIEKINLSLPIYEGTEDKVLLKGIGHMKNTHLPSLEEKYHTILAGHTGIMAKTLFDDLPKLEIGDLFQITIWNKDFNFEVCEIKIIDPFDNNVFNQDGQYVTLVTCTPKYINSHRLLVTGKAL